MENIRDFYLVNSILSTMVEDALRPNVVTDKILDVKYGDSKGKNDKIQAELDERFGFDDLATDVAEEILAYGEFIYNTKLNQKEGLVDIIDNSDQERIIPIVKHGVIDKYLVVDEEFSMGYRNMNYSERPPEDFIRFRLGSKKIRIRLADSIWGDLGQPTWFRKKSRTDIDKFPRYIRLGRSALYPIIGKIKELDLLEKLVPASQLAQLAQGTVLGVQVPENTAPENALDACRKVENSLNRKIAMDKTNQWLSVEDIIASSGAYKAVPVFGQTGQLSKLDYKSDEPSTLLNQIQDLRKAICSSIGFPYEIFYGADQNEKKSDVLRRYTRYLSLLRSIQVAIMDGIKELIIIHLLHKKGVPDFEPNLIVVTCENKLVNIGETERLEFFDVSASMLGSN